MKNNIKKIILALKILFLLSSAIIYISYDLMATGIHRNFIEWPIFVLFVPLIMSIILVISYVRAKIVQERDGFLFFISVLYLFNIFKILALILLILIEFSLIGGILSVQILHWFLVFILLCQIVFFTIDTRRNIKRLKIRESH